MGSHTAAMRDLSLPVLAVDNHTLRGTSIRKSRSGPRRAAVLVTIQLLMIAHVGLWILSQKFGWFSGRTLTPVEPSESMQTLELGFVNAGFVFFSVALLSTLIFGRWVCGWACHIVMLQDFCAWIMKKCGVRPKPFRSRILIWVPLLLALYMFVWPTFKRLALFPVLESVWPAASAFFAPVPPWQGFSNHLIDDAFWINAEAQTQFPIIMAIPTLLIAGFAAVYFLGAKGFCTYGCPYGGFFAPLDEFATGRIRVTDACEGCGHCTVACTSNVRVHEEVREYGMVVDSGCMKCLDCVSTCPNDALYFGFGKPATRKGRAKNREPKRTYDLTLREDLSLAIVFLVSLYGLRGLYLGEGVPLLMAVGGAGVISFLAFKTWRLFMKSNDIVRVQNLKLKWRGRVTRAGWSLTAMTAVLGVIVIDASIVGFSKSRAQSLLSNIPPNEALKARELDREPGSVEAASAALPHLRRSLGVRDGGLAIMTDPAIFGELAIAHGVLGQFTEGSEALLRFIELSGEHDGLVTNYVQFMGLDDRSSEGIAYGEQVFSRHPEFSRLFHEIVAAKKDSEGLQSAYEFGEAVRQTREDWAPPYVELAIIHNLQGEYDLALSLADRARELAPDEPVCYQVQAEAYFKSGSLPEARDVLRDAKSRFPDQIDVRYQLALVYQSMNDPNAAQKEMDEIDRLVESTGSNRN